MPTFAERAATLVETAHLVAQGTLDWPSRLLNQHIDPARWVFYTTVGGAFTAMQLLVVAGASEDEGLEVAQALFETLEAWDPDGRAAYNDCGQFFNRHLDVAMDHHEYRQKKSLLIADGVGHWIVFNVLRREPREADEFAAVRAVGAALFKLFRDWWGVDLEALG